MCSQTKHYIVTLGWLIVDSMLNWDLQKKLVLFASMKALENGEKCFLFHLKSSICSKVI